MMKNLSSLIMQAQSSGRNKSALIKSALGPMITEAVTEPQPLSVEGKCASMLLEYLETLGNAERQKNLPFKPFSLHLVIGLRKLMPFKSMKEEICVFN